MSTDEPRIRRRERQTNRPRSFRVNLAYNDLELAIIKTAATSAGLKPAAYAARMALSVAKEEMHPAPLELKDQLRELMQARIAVNRIGTNLNQIARVLNSEGEESPARLEAVLSRAEAAILRLDEATAAVVQAMGGEE